jgi:hypothetical protein
VRHEAELERARCERNAPRIRTPRKSRLLCARAVSARQSGRSVRPLAPVRRELVLWEHLRMLDRDDYKKEWEKKKAWVRR